MKEYKTCNRHKKYKLKKKKRKHKPKIKGCGIFDQTLKNCGTLWYRGLGGR